MGARSVNGWQLNTTAIGVYGNYYLKRAIVAMIGPGTNLPEDAIYPLNLGDSEGEPLTGANNYELSFAKDETAAGGRLLVAHALRRPGYPVANALDRFALSSWMPLADQPGRFARPVLPAREPRRRQGERTGCRRRTDRST